MIMSDNFKRIYYEDFTGFYVHHTWGDDASSSTVKYLHYDTDSFFDRIRFRFHGLSFLNTTFFAHKSTKEGG